MTSTDHVTHARPWRWAALLVLPYLVLSLCWTFSNPPGAAPDETDHLVKALGNARGSIGTAVAPLPAGGPLILERNNSTTRGFEIPADLEPVGYTCFAFQALVTADCLPATTEPRPGGDTTYYSTLGAYPPFLYVPIGLVALTADSPGQAIISARLFVVLASSLLLLLGLGHLIRWLGRGAALGYVALLTPAVVFLDGSLSPSAIELAAAAAVASVVTVALLEPDSLHRPATHATMAAAGVVLALSRQLGLLALGVLVLVLLIGVGWTHLRRVLVARQPSFVAAVALLGLASVAVLWWERTYDHPAHVGSPLALDAVSPFLSTSYFVLASGIGNFGWLDTPMPGQATGLWIGMWVLVISLAFLLGRRRDAAVVALMVLGTGALAFAIYASAFFPIGAGIQGRHFLPVFCLALILSGAVVARTLGRVAPVALRRLVTGVAVLAAGVQWLALYANGRRYAVGAQGPWWWVPDARWSPPLGWVPWLALAALACVLLAVVVTGCAPRVQSPTARRPAAAGSRVRGRRH